MTALGVPILAGPELITTAMNFDSTGGTKEIVITIVELAVICLIVYLAFLSKQRLLRIPGYRLDVITRIIGLL